MVHNKEIIEKAPKDFLALILFGSYARKDFDRKSDVDIALVSHERGRTISVHKFNYTIYTEEQLIQMAREGNIFIYHLMTEGTEITKKNILVKLRGEFKKRENYQDFRNSIKKSSEFLNIEKSDYKLYFKKLNSLCMFLLRSYIYSLIMDSKNISFSKKRIFDFISEKNYKFLESLKESNQCNFFLFLEGKKILYSIIHEDLLNEKNKSLHVMIVNAYKEDKFTYILGLRLLNVSDKNITY